MSHYDYEHTHPGWGLALPPIAGGGGGGGGGGITKFFPKVVYVFGIQTASDA